MEIRTLLILVLASLGCGLSSCSSGDMEPTVLRPCLGPVGVTVTPSGDTPVFSWVPACRVTRLEVFSIPGHDAEDLGSSQWRVESSTLLTPPIRYGVVPGSAEAVPPVPLLVGNAYLVFVERDTSGIVVSEGSATFVR
jgi:hypothetical protein